MSNLTLKGNLSGSGTFTLESPNSNSSRTLILPDASDTLVGADAAQTLRNKTIQGGAITLATAKTATGTFVDFTDIPSWVKRVTVMFSAVSTSGTSPVQIQLGDSGGLETTGYNSGAFSYDSGSPATSTTGLVVDEDVGGAAASRYGAYVLTLLDGNVWVGRGNLIVSNVTLSAGGKTLSATLDRIRITTVNGTDTFDAGTINIMYEG